MKAPTEEELNGAVVVESVASGTVPGVEYEGHRVLGLHIAGSMLVTYLVDDAPSIGMTVILALVPESAGRLVGHILEHADRHGYLPAVQAQIDQARAFIRGRVSDQAYNDK